ncbi:MAG: TolC family protein [Betaproteobacteria bacterium]
MFPIPHPARAALAVLAAFALAGCASTAIDDNIAAARADVHARAGIDFAWLASDAARAQARDDVARTLARPLAADDAVRITLSYDPALQALLFERAAASAEATQGARLPNPVFAFERLASGGAGGQVEQARALTLPLLDVLLLPARLRQAEATQQALRLQLAGDVLRGAAAARTDWIAAVAAAQSASYAQQVHETAELAADLARRLEASGSFSALQRAREEAFAGDTLAALAQARRARRGARETLVRALGLDSGQAAAMTLPERLPDLPATAPADDAALQAALANRLDVRLAQARLDAIGRAQGLTRVTAVVDGLELGAERRTQTGQPGQHGVTLSVPLPLFDTGDAARAGAAATYQAALARGGALAVEAASQLRAAQADVRESHALALQLRDRLVPLRATIVGENLLRYNGMLASVFDLLADAREQARTVQLAISAQRDFWLADATLKAAAMGAPRSTDDLVAMNNPAEAK